MFGPKRAPHLGKFGGELRAAHVFLDEFDAGGGHVDPRALGKLDLEKLLGAVLLLEQLEPAVAADAMGHVHDVIPLVQVEESVDRPREPVPRRPHGDILAAEELGARQNHELLRHEPKATGEMTAGKVEPFRLRRRAPAE